MIPGVGVDLVEVVRIRAAMDRQGERFLKRIFTERELASLGQGPLAVQRLAGRFAAKEAVFKVLGLGLGNLSWQDVEVLGGRGQPPTVCLQGKAAEVAASEGIQLSVSISHTREHAMAVAMVRREGP